MLTKKEILALIKAYGYMRLSDSDGACACGQLNFGGIHIRSHCHRTGKCCAYSGVHVWKEDDSMLTPKELKEIGKSVANYLEKSYMTNVSVTLTSGEEEAHLGY